MTNAWRSVMFVTFIKPARERARCAPDVYLCCNTSLLSPKRHSTSFLVRDMIAAAYMENRSASEEWLDELWLVVALMTSGWTDGAWITLERGLTFSRNFCHRIKAWVAEGYHWDRSTSPPELPGRMKPIGSKKWLSLVVDSAVNCMQVSLKSRPYMYGIIIPRHLDHATNFCHYSVGSFFFFWPT